jgi:hypothetical protein
MLDLLKNPLPVTERFVQTPVPQRAGPAFWGQIMFRMFSQSEQETSSTYRDLLAIQFTIQAFEPLLTGCKAKLFTVRVKLQ